MDWFLHEIHSNDLLYAFFNLWGYFMGIFFQTWMYRLSYISIYERFHWTPVLQSINIFDTLGFKRGTAESHYNKSQFNDFFLFHEYYLDWVKNPTVWHYKYIHFLIFKAFQINEIFKLTNLVKFTKEYSFQFNESWSISKWLA